MNQFAYFVEFNIFVVVMLLLDSFVFHRKAHEVKLKEALLFSAFWILLALAFNVLIYQWQGKVKAMEFLTGYVIEKSLSVDNLFVFLFLFSYFHVEPRYQHKILFWGIMGALVMRIIFIFAGVALIERFHWMIYLFGAFLVYTGFKMAFQGETDVSPEKNPVLRILRKIIPISHEHEGGHFFVKRDGRWMATSLFIVLIVVESTDVVFAVDSIPAILAISTDQFIVYTSNVFAILGLRALYFALAGVMQLFHYLKYGLSFILVFVGIKMLISSYYKVPIGLALGVVAGVLALSVLASFLFPKKEELPSPPPVQK